MFEKILSGDLKTQCCCSKCVGQKEKERLFCLGWGSASIFQGKYLSSFLEQTAENCEDVTRKMDISSNCLSRTLNHSILICFDLSYASKLANKLTCTSNSEIHPRVQQKWLTHPYLGLLTYLSIRIDHQEFSITVKTPEGRRELQLTHQLKNCSGHSGSWCKIIQSIHILDTI